MGGREGVEGEKGGGRGVGKTVLKKGRVMLSQGVACPCSHLLVETQTGFKWLVEGDCMFNYSLDCR